MTAFNGSTGGIGGSIWLLLLKYKKIKLSIFICWTGDCLAEDENVILDYKVRLFSQINICVVIVILIRVQI